MKSFIDWIRKNPVFSIAFLLMLSDVVFATGAPTAYDFRTASSMPADVTKIFDNAMSSIPLMTGAAVTLVALKSTIPLVAGLVRSIFSSQLPLGMLLTTMKKLNFSTKLILALTFWFGNIPFAYAADISGITPQDIQLFYNYLIVVYPLIVGYLLAPIALYFGGYWLISVIYSSFSRQETMPCIFFYFC